VGEGLLSEAAAALAGGGIARKGEEKYFPWEGGKGGGEKHFAAKTSCEGEKANRGDGLCFVLDKNETQPERKREKEAHCSCQKTKGKKSPFRHTKRVGKKVERRQASKSEGGKVVQLHLTQGKRHGGTESKSPSACSNIRLRETSLVPLREEKETLPPTIRCFTRFTRALKKKKGKRRHETAVSSIHQIEQGKGEKRSFTISLGHVGQGE